VNGEEKTEKSGVYDSQVVRIPLKMQEGIENPPELNMSNVNARVLLCDILGYQSDILEEYPNISANELLMKVEMIEDNDYVIGKNSRQTEVSGHMTSFGLSKERIKMYLDSLKNICQYALDNHYTYISIG
jgi:hypothetical protein